MKRWLALGCCLALPALADPFDCVKSCEDIQKNCTEACAKKAKDKASYCKPKCQAATDPCREQCKKEEK